MRIFKNVLVTGGAGFIGSHVVTHFVNKYPGVRIINLDKLTYAGNLENLKSIEKAPNYHFVKGCITDEKLVDKIFSDFQPDLVLHLAAESHVDRSIKDPLAFVKTNVIGTLNLLIQAKKHWQNNFENKVFYQISTDEVYGSLGPSGYFNENTKYDPRSPYSASKASADHFVRAYFHTYRFPVVLSNCSNNYGPYQFPEKLIPLMIHNILNHKTLPVYGDGKNIRDWLYVQDHVEAIDRIAHQGIIGETYNIGGDQEVENIQLVHLLCDLTDLKLGRQEKSSRRLISFVQDRLGHDRRYAIDASKIKYELQWKPSKDVKEGLSLTIDWYLTNKKWLEHVTSGAYREYYKSMYNVVDHD